jgi:DNA-binding transcriptional LysR family regulator
MHISQLDLNLLRIFDAVYEHRNVSRAAEQLNLSQPAVSHGLTRLRLLLGDALFVRTGGGVRPTPRAEQLAQAVQHALRTLQQALAEPGGFVPERSTKTFRLHMSDFGEGVFLPGLMQSLGRAAPGVRIETHQLAYGQIQDALDAGRIDLAIGYLPGVDGLEQQPLLHDRYVALVRAAHPLEGAAPAADVLRRLDYIVVRQHTETVRLLQLLGLDDRVRLSIPHFMAISAILAETDLAVIVPQHTALGFVQRGAALRILELEPGQADFSVALHWSRRWRDDPALRWLRGLIIERYREFAGPWHPAEPAPPA